MLVKRILITTSRSSKIAINAILDKYGIIYCGIFAPDSWSKVDIEGLHCVPIIWTPIKTDLDGIQNIHIDIMNKFGFAHYYLDWSNPTLDIARFLFKIAETAQTVTHVGVKDSFIDSVRNTLEVIEL